MSLIQTAAQSSMLLVLVAAAVRSVALAAVAGAALALCRVKATSARLFTWTAVLYGALALPFLFWALPSIQVPVPAWMHNTALHARTGSASPKIVAPGGGPDFGSKSPETIRMERSVYPAALPHSSPAESSQAPTRAREAEISLDMVATTIYVAIALMLLSRFLLGIALTRRLVKRSQELTDARLKSIVSARADWARSTARPFLRESSAISIPVTVGPIRSTILLPANWRDWEDEKLHAVIAHEMSHVSRHDPLSQCMALLHRAIFWFSPLAWWLNRHIAELAEQASDEAALCAGADRTHYARTLLQFFETLHAAPNRVWWQGVSMAHAGQAEKRFERILAERGAAKMGIKKSVAVIIVAFAIPVVFLTAAARPTEWQQSSRQPSNPPDHVSPAPAGTHLAPPLPSGAPATPSLPAAPEEGVSNSGPEPAAPIAPAMPVGPVEPGPVGAPLAVGPVGQNHRYNRGFSYSYGFDDDQRFVIVTGNSDSLTMSGSSEDARHVDNLRKQIPGDFIWFQRDEKSYIIRDQATIDRARKLWAPQEELGRKQEELGRQQETLGKQQEELGARMEEVKIDVPDMTAELDRLKAKLQKLGPKATMEQIGELQSEIGELQSKIGELQSHAGDQQGKIGEEMGALGEQQGKLGEQQGKLGQQQGELAEKATHEMKQLLDEAIKNGTAKPEPDETGGASL